MPVCEWCGRNFDRAEAAEIFECERSPFMYSNIHKCLCGDCAISAIENMVEDVYFETCEKCGKEFDCITNAGRFSDNFSPESAGLFDCWTLGKGQILCCDCALENIDELFPMLG